MNVDDTHGGIPAGDDAETSDNAVDDLCLSALAAAHPWGQTGRTGRGKVLLAIAEAIEADADGIVATADQETNLGPARLSGELARTTAQLRLFRDVLSDGGYLEATLDHSGQTAGGLIPDIRRMLVPIGPVAVFGASNFPLAFSVPGGDTASALAAGCPVLVKAHPAHPLTSQRCFAVLKAAAARAGAPDGTLSLVVGQDAGARLVQNPAVRAVAFTGSTAGGRVLHDLAAGRRDPIPFYGELGSVNPVVVSPNAAKSRAGALGLGLMESLTLGAGQYCTKPGLIMLPEGPDGDAVNDALIESLVHVPPQRALHRGVAAAYVDGLEHFAEYSRKISTAQHAPSSDDMAGALFEVRCSDIRAEMLREVFGPVAVVIRYPDLETMTGFLDRLEPCLVAAVFCDDGDPFTPSISAVLSRIAGRIVFNAYPTGVAVTWAMQHGGPWPASTSLHSSVGPSAIRRFLRPVAWQNAPQHVLPPELRDEERGDPIPRRIDGILGTRARNVTQQSPGE